MKILLTGANGFVAHHMIEALRKRGDTTIGVDIAPTATNAPDRYVACDLTNAAAIRELLASERPEAIVHLAAVSSVGRSWEIPAETFTQNSALFLNVTEAVRTLGLKARILSVGSSEEYGAVPVAEQPIAETRPVAPTNPYAVSRVAQEQLSLLYARSFGLDIVITRSFNQFGPGQRPNFVVPSFVQQIKDGKARGERIVPITAGDLTIVRDFLDVRDAVSAYLLLLDRGRSGEIYNICSGTGHALQEILDTIAERAGVTVNVTIDPARIRPTDNPCIIGDNTKLRALGWIPRHTLESSIEDMLKHKE